MQLDGNPLAIYDRRWNPVSCNALWAALMGLPSDRPRSEQNLAWRTFSGLPTRIVRSEAERALFEANMAADLQATAGRYPKDGDLRSLVGGLLATSSRFRELWESRCVGFYQEERKVVEHPDLGPLVLDWTVLNTHLADFRTVLVTAQADSDSTEALTRLRAKVIGKAYNPDRVDNYLRVDELESYRGR